jgi:hypothetical protein
MRTPMTLMALFFASVAVAAPPPPEVTPVPDGPPGPDDVPAITIRPGSKGRVEEYRANGRVYMLKITPRNGKPYYLIDARGDGTFVRRDALDGGVIPPMWIIKEF